MDKGEKMLTGSLVKSAFHERCGSFPENLLSVLFTATTKQPTVAFEWPTGRRILYEKDNPRLAVCVSLSPCYLEQCE